MATENYQNVRAAYAFFRSNAGSETSLRNIANATGWKESSVSTYFNKKWKNLVLERTGRGIYRVCMPEDMTLEAFGALHSQVDEHLR